MSCVNSFAWFMYCSGEVDRCWRVIGLYRCIAFYLCTNYGCKGSSKFCRIMLQNLHFLLPLINLYRFFPLRKTASGKCLFVKDSQTILQIRTDYYLKIMWEIKILIKWEILAMHSMSWTCLIVLFLRVKIHFQNLPPDKWFKLILRSLKESMIHVL